MFLEYDFVTNVLTDGCGKDRSIQYVLAHLEEANFDPEFFTRHEQEIMTAFALEYQSIKIEIPASI